MADMLTSSRRPLETLTAGTHDGGTLHCVAQVAFESETAVADPKVDLAIEKEDARQLFALARGYGEIALLDSVADMQEQTLPKLLVQICALDQRIVHGQPVISAIEDNAVHPHEIADPDALAGGWSRGMLV
ncbi:hypothetical protein QEZ47_02570 [Aminobacter anthyllidis]|uniref:hypothetical protein n=1 Tax=Aminobacter anthyllidis TaxID=1035067 RepID=UPI002454E9BA|nr:hypothetical protein [Aminobacter anthyllidis]MDH4984460.1 hypothetical protein [Aminobacter anthyllidis]